MRFPLYAMMSLLLATAPAFAAEKLMVMDGYVVPTTGKATAAYLTLHNMGSTPVTIQSLSSPKAKSVEAHQTIVTDGVARMRPITPFTIAPNDQQAFEPDSDHIMIMGLTAPLQPDQAFPLVIQFADGQSQTVDLPVQATTKVIQ